MKTMKSLYIGAALMAAAAMGATAAAQSWPTTDGSVWVASRVDILPGQGPAYLDYLASDWKKEMEWGKSQGYILSYRVLRTNHARNGEPDVVLLVEYKDYTATAERQAVGQRFNAAMGTNARQRAVANAEREKIRTQMGSTEYQELILK
jgi:opacity protein-like surface antigen